MTFKKNKFEKNSSRQKVRFKIYGEKIIEKTVNPCGKNGRVYLPPEWIGTKIKIVRC